MQMSNDDDDARRDSRGEVDPFSVRHDRCSGNYPGPMSFAQPRRVVNCEPKNQEGDLMPDLTFQNNVPDPLVAGKELPQFTFALEKSRGKVMGASFGKEATVEQLPISKGIAGVSMRIEPGGMRELHWHATAAEWAFVLEGHVRTTVI